MDEQSPATVGVRRHSTRLRAIVGTALAAFVLGGALTWFVVRWDDPIGGLLELRRDETVGHAQQDPGRQPMEAKLAGSAADAALVAGPEAALDQRIAAMEQRLARLDVQAAAAAGNAGRAEGLLIAFASRRAIERGVPLGYLADQLRLRFGAAQPDAVRTVIDAANAPVTLDRLLAQLDGMAPALGQAPKDEGAFDWFSRELGELFVVRRENAPSPAPEKRLERARLFLESGRTDAAVAEVRMLPNAAEAQGWIADAARYAAAQRALEAIEIAAIGGQPGLRDGAGNPVS
jgi:hypothetical protein